MCDGANFRSRAVTGRGFAVSTATPMHSQSCLAFRVEPSSVAARVKIESYDALLGIETLPAYLSSALESWARASGTAEPVPNVSSSAADLGTPVVRPTVEAVTAAANSPDSILSVQITGVSKERALDNFTVRRSGRIPAERLHRAASMGAAWGAYARSEAPLPRATEPSGLNSMAWVVLRPSLAAKLQAASVHTRRGSHAAQTHGLWHRVSTPTPW